MGQQITWRRAFSETKIAWEASYKRIAWPKVAGMAILADAA